MLVLPRGAGRDLRNGLMRRAWLCGQGDREGLTTIPSNLARQAASRRGAGAALPVAAHQLAAEAIGPHQALGAGAGQKPALVVIAATGIAADDEHRWRRCSGGRAGSGAGALGARRPPAIGAIGTIGAIGAFGLGLCVAAGGM